MPSGLLVRLQPYGPIRAGSHLGADGVDRLVHSDTLYSALTHAIAELDSLDEWLSDTARGAEGSSVVLSSCFPYLDDTLYVTPPKTAWPPAGFVKERWKAAKFVPLSVVRGLLEGKPFEEDRWQVDVPSQCLTAVSRLPRTTGPFRPAVRRRAAVDRGSEGVVDAYSCSCVEFRAGAGLWALVSFRSDQAVERWSRPVQAAFRLLGDSGIGGERSSGWGHFRVAEFREGAVAELLGEAVPRNGGETEGGSNAFWLLSLCSPSEQDQIDWARGEYSLVERSGRMSATGQLKKSVRMIEEGSVLIAGALQGSARDVAPEGAPHPAYASGFALGLSIPLRENA